MVNQPPGRSDGGGEASAKTEAEDPKLHCAANGRSVINTHTMERHYENTSNVRKLISTPVLIVLTWTTMHNSA